MDNKICGIKEASEKNDITNSIILDVLEDIKSLLEPSSPGNKRKSDDVDVDLNLRRSKRRSSTIASEKIKYDISHENSESFGLKKVSENSNKQTSAAKSDNTSSIGSDIQAPFITKFKSEFEKFVSAKETEISGTTVEPVFHESISVTRVPNEKIENDENPDNNLADSSRVTINTKKKDSSNEEIV